ncbi:putative MFS-type transporter YhjX [Rubripirellula lacrimiformis]|uniref:Putative MFS-type transporter YhjX n=1 Tax=Rubripirellula lacrimiformis TaxID=1930273 RepID=A0A517NL36_9BACT|nr:putative MFS-type transporter YhjX [Rubripirellula lacrimiformis]
MIDQAAADSDDGRNPTTVTGVLWNRRRPANWLSDGLALRLPFFYGYVMIPVAMLLLIATSPGQTFAFSAFLPAIRQSLVLSESELSFAYMLGTLLAAIPLLLVGPLADRFGLRSTSFVAALALGCTCWFASTISGWYGLLAAFFLLRFLGQGTLSLLGNNTTAMWFRSRIGRVSAVISIGTSVAFAWVPEMVNDSIAEIGWQATYRWIAIAVTVVIVPMVVLLFRERPEDLGQRVDGASPDSDVVAKDIAKTGNHSVVATTTVDEPSWTMAEALRTRSYFILAVTNVSWAMIGTGVVFYLYTICQQRGLGSNVASDMFKTLGLAMLVGQLVGGVLADFVALNRLLGIGVTLLLAGIVMLVGGETEWLSHGFAFLFGGGQGMLLAVGSAVWVRYFGREHLGTIRGSVWCMTVAGSGCGPLLMGLSHDRLGSFQPALLAFGGTLFVASACAWFATPPERKQHVKAGGSAV